MGFFSKIFDANGKKRKGGKDEVAAVTESSQGDQRRPLEFMGANKEAKDIGVRKETLNKPASPYQMSSALLESPKAPFRSAPGPTASTSSLHKLSAAGELSASSSSSIDTADSSSSIDASTPITTPSTSSPSVVMKSKNGSLTPPSPHGVVPQRPSPLSSAVDPGSLSTPTPLSSQKGSAGTADSRRRNSIKGYFNLRKARSSSHLPPSGTPSNSSTSIPGSGPGSYIMARPPARPRSSMGMSAPHQHYPGYFTPDLASIPALADTASPASLISMDPIGRGFHLYPTTPNHPVSPLQEGPKRAAFQPTESYKSHVYRRRLVQPTIVEEMIPRGQMVPMGYPTQARTPMRPDNPRRRSFHSTGSSPAPFYHAPPSQMPARTPRPEHQRRRSVHNNMPPPPPPQQMNHDGRLRAPIPNRGPPREKPVDDMLLGINMLNILERREQEEEQQREIMEREEKRKSQAMEAITMMQEREQESIGEALKAEVAA